MKLEVGPTRITLHAQTDAERDLSQTLTASAGGLYRIAQAGGRGLVFEAVPDPGMATLEPLNITQGVGAPFAAISNLATTPFILDDEIYASVEGFWQSLKFTELKDRRRVAALSGSAAKKAGNTAPPQSVTFDYHGETIVRGTWAHWALMGRACEAKFYQDVASRRALLATGERLLTHRVANDSRTIPGVIMAEIWMRVRAGLQP